MNTETRLKSLKLAWKSKDYDYVYIISILAKMGHKPEFPNVSKYNQLWAFVTAGRLIGEDVAEWEPKLEEETQRLREVTAEYEPEKRRLEESIAEHRAKMAALKQVQEELDAAMSRKLGY